MTVIVTIILIALILFKLTRLVNTYAEAVITDNRIDYLVLVNKYNPISDDWKKFLQTVTVTTVSGDEAVVEAKTCEAYTALKKCLEENEGIYLELDSAMRSIAAQQELMKHFIEKYGEDYTAKTVAVPGYSEHHTGLALDICFRYRNENDSFVDVCENEDMEKCPDIWEKIHARLADYGFILRYPEGREHITGYSYEPWHIRYVGSADDARAIMGKDITLEEYLGAVNPAAGRM